MEKDKEGVGRDMNKCKKCGQYKPLIGDYCSECLSLNAYESYKASKDILGEIEEEETDPSFNFTSFYKGYCDSLVKEYEEKHKGTEDKTPTLDEALDAIFYEIMKSNGISDEEVTKYRPQLNHIVKTYMYQLKTGFYRISTKDDFEQQHLGVVRDVKGRWVVYTLETPEDRVGVVVNITAEQEEYVSTANLLLQKYLKDKETD